MVANAKYALMFIHLKCLSCYCKYHCNPLELPGGTRHGTVTGYRALDLQALAWDAVVSATIISCPASTQVLSLTVAAWAPRVKSRLRLQWLCCFPFSPAVLPQDGGPAVTPCLLPAEEEPLRRNHRAAPGQPAGGGLGSAGALSQARGLQAPGIGLVFVCVCVCGSFCTRQRCILRSVKVF